jgi:gliding motility-associated-like protein
VLSLNEPITFNNESTGDIVNITWDFGDGSFNVVGDYNPTHIYTAIGTYQVELTVEYPFGCTEIFTEILEITKGYDIVLPNAFTPNGDGVNDTIRPVTLCMAEIQMSIYDTWGSLLYVEVGEDDTLIGWDGTIKGRPAENGNYIIVVEATTYRGETIELNGPITLIK